MEEYQDTDSDLYYFRNLDKDNGASRLAKMLLEDCTHLRLFIGTAINPAHQNPNLPSDLSIKQKLINQLIELVEKMGKKVERTYY